ncbi:MAG: PAS domain-containing protein, partial [Candidatus Heimdallarchaeota archaeon]|nr:PAS domain-containing protein [Candidatus Heimdallarchaeota archaeon]MCK4876512.1 PAS domain-containing protein [Candidatus Heimdallarchaeota archaeon]
MNPHQLQIARETRLDDTLYKKTVYDIVQREVTKQKRVKTDSYVQKETLKGINDSVFILDFEGNILEVNEVAYKTRGYTEEEMLSLNILDIMSSENKDLFDSRIEDLKRMGEITFETTHYCKDESVLDIEFKTKIISYDNQEFILSVGRDITERKRVEKEAKASEEKYRSIFNNANDTIFLLKECEDGRFNKIVEANKQAVEMYGYSKEELLKMSPDDFNATGYVETEETLNEFLKERRIRFERTHKTKDGEIIDVEISSQLFEIDGETVSHAMVQDITEKKKLEKERESVEKQLQLMKHSLDSSLSGITVSDLNDKIIYVNNSYLQLWGYENSEELLGKGAKQILPCTQTSTKVAQEAMSELLKSGRWVGDIQSEKQDGSPIWVRMNLNLVYDPNDKP